MNGTGSRRDGVQPRDEGARRAGDADSGAGGAADYRVLKSTTITLAGAGFLAGGFTLGLRREMRKFRELAEQRKKGGKFVGPPNFELGARAFGYGTLLCAAAGVLAWAAIQYTFGVTNISEFGDAMRVWVPERSRGIRRFFEGLPLPESYKRKREEMMAQIPEDERKMREFFGVEEDGSGSDGADGSADKPAVPVEAEGADRESYE